MPQRLFQDAQAVRQAAEGGRIELGLSAGRSAASAEAALALAGVVDGTATLSLQPDEVRVARTWSWHVLE